MKQPQILFSLLFSLSLLISCAEEPSIEPRVPEPQIEIVSITPTEVQEFNNEVVITISYTDFNGDLGTEDPDEQTLLVQDSRLDTPDGFHVPPIAPIGEEVPISGTLVIPLNPLFLLGNGDQETAFFTLKIKDRAGNWSEEVISETVTINR
ncbi:MAG: hypothetical protein AAF206_03865 [Bacteroidota bacterium]